MLLSVFQYFIVFQVSLLCKQLLIVWKYCFDEQDGNIAILLERVPPFITILKYTFRRMSCDWGGKRGTDLQQKLTHFHPIEICYSDFV